MKRVIIGALSVVLFVVVSVANGNSKITILHKQKEIIEISINALPAHIEHGDVVMVLFNGKWISQAEYDLISSGADVFNPDFGSMSY